MPKAILRPPRKRALREQINAQREELFKAQAVVNCVRFASASKYVGLDETHITIALQVASDLIDDVAAALELIGVSRRSVAANVSLERLGEPYHD
jgi:hypothetical protein